MADLEVGVNITGKSGDAKKFGDQIAGSLKKSLGRLGFGRAGAIEAGAVAGGAEASGKGSLAKLAGIAAAILVVVSGLDFIVKPVMAILKAILILLFLPLIPILIPVLKILGSFIRILAPIMPRIMSLVEEMVNKTFIPVLLENLENIEKFAVMFIGFLIKMAEVFISSIPSINSMLEFFAEKGSELFQVVLDALQFAAGFMLGSWETIKEIFKWVGTWLEPVWKVIRTALEEAHDILVSKWDDLRDALDAIIGGFGFILEKIRGFLSKIPLIGGAFSKPKGRQIGGLISQEGMHFLHRGERVVSATERRKHGGGVIVNLSINKPTVRNDVDIDRMVREIERNLQTSLRRYVSFT